MTFAADSSTIGSVVDKREDGVAVDRATVPKATFLNFDLEIGASQAAPDGRVEFPVRAAQTPRAQVQSADAADRVSIPAGEIDAVVAALANRWDVSETEFAKACQALERWLLPQPSRVRSLLESSLAGLDAGECLSVRIRCSDDNLARLPWEFATFGVGEFPDDGRFHIDRTLAMHPRICLVRFDELTAPVERTEGPSLRLLFASAIPPALDALALHVERERIERELTDAKLAAERTWLEHVTGDSLQRALDGARFDVFQYSGHGGSGGGGFLCFEGTEASDGRFPANNLGLLLAGKGVRVAVLAACVTAEIEVALPWSSVARALVAGGVPAVVGMQLNIGDASAIEFLSTFYRKLAGFMPVGAAINEARKSIALQGRPGFRRARAVPAQRGQLGRCRIRGAGRAIRVRAQDARRRRVQAPARRPAQGEDERVSSSPRLCQRLSAVQRKSIAILRQNDAGLRHRNARHRKREALRPRYSSTAISSTRSSATSRTPPRSSKRRSRPRTATRSSMRFRSSTPCSGWT